MRSYERASWEGGGCRGRRESAQAFILGPGGSRSILLDGGRIGRCGGSCCLLGPIVKTTPAEPAFHGVRPGSHRQSRPSLADC